MQTKKKLGRGIIVSHRTDDYLLCVCRCGHNELATSTSQQLKFRLPHRILQCFGKAGDRQELQRRHPHLSKIQHCCFYHHYQVEVHSFPCTCVVTDPGSAQGVLGWAGYHGDVWEKSRTLWGVLESCSGDVAEALQFQHGYDCSN